MTRGLPLRAGGEVEKLGVRDDMSQIIQLWLRCGEYLVAEVIKESFPQNSVATPRVGKPGSGLQEVGHNA